MAAVCIWYKEEQKGNKTGMNQDRVYENRRNSYQGNPPESSEPSNPSKPNDPSKPVKTGDTTPVLAYVGIAAGSLLLIATLAYFRKHNQKKQ